MWELWAGPATERGMASPELIQLQSGTLSFLFETVLKLCLNSEANLTWGYVSVPAAENGGLHKESRGHRHLNAYKPLLRAVKPTQEPLNISYFF